MPRSLLAALAALLALMPTIALACGIPLEARITYEQALLIVRGDRQELVATVSLSEAAPNAAVVFPVPAEPTVDQPAGGDTLFSYLAEATRPAEREEVELRWDLPRDGVAGGAPPDGVLLGREILGGYDVARLAAADPQALSRWLAENSYVVPPAAEPILAAYVSDGWSFVAVKLAAEAPEGALSPLRISYTHPQLVYPMRLGALSDRPVGVDLYVLAEHRMETDRLPTFYAGPVGRLDPQPPAELADLLGAAPYLTRMRALDLAPATLAEDFVIGQAPNDDPYRTVVTVYREVYVLREYGIFAAMVCGSLISVAALIVAFGIVGRINRVAGPDPRER